MSSSNMENNKGIYGLVALVAAAIFGVFFFTGNDAAVTASPAGATFNTAKVAAININPRSITSTSTSLYNSDANDRIVTDAFVTCSGLTNMISSTGGVATFRWGAATSSVAAPTASILGATLAAMNTTVATSSSDGYVATTTYTSPFSRRWNSGSYMIFETNATSSAATCQAGVHYLAI